MNEGFDQPNVDASGTESVPSPQTPAFDPQAFEAKLKMFGPDWSLQNWEEKLSKTRSDLGEKGRRLAEMEQEHAPLKPLVEAMKDQNFRAHMHSSVASYYDNQQPQAPQQFSADTFDPLAQLVNNQDIQLRTMQIDRELDKLESSGFPMDQARRDTVIERCLRTRWGSARDNYMAEFGDQLIADREKAAIANTAAALQKNAGAYKNAPTRTPMSPSGGVNVATMTPAQFSAYAQKRANEIIGEAGGYE
jgi:hypothetical protein